MSGNVMTKPLGNKIDVETTQPTIIAITGMCSWVWAFGLNHSPIRKYWAIKAQNHPFVLD